MTTTTKTNEIERQYVESLATDTPEGRLLAFSLGGELRLPPALVRRDLDMIHGIRLSLADGAGVDTERKLARLSDDAAKRLEAIRRKLVELQRTVAQLEREADAAKAELGQCQIRRENIERHVAVHPFAGRALSKELQAIGLNI